VYEIGGDIVWILTLVHAAHRWPLVRGAWPGAQARRAPAKIIETGWLLDLTQALEDEAEEAARDAFHTDPSGRSTGRYWDRWARHDRTHPLLVGVVETLGEKARMDFQGA
jgi:hypothetical protein